MEIVTRSMSEKSDTGTLCPGVHQKKVTQGQCSREKVRKKVKQGHCDWEKI